MKTRMNIATLTLMTGMALALSGTAQGALITNGDFETFGAAIGGSGLINSVNGIGWIAENLAIEAQNSSAANGLETLTMSGLRWGRVSGDLGGSGALNQDAGIMNLGELYTLTGDVLGGPSVGGPNYIPVVEFRRGSAVGAVLASQSFSLANGVADTINLSYSSIAADAGQALFVRLSHPTTAGGTNGRGGFDELVLTTTSTIPEPSTLALAALGLVAVTLARRWGGAEGLRR